MNRTRDWVVAGFIIGLGIAIVRYPAALGCIVVVGVILAILLTIAVFVAAIKLWYIVVPLGVLYIVLFARRRVDGRP